MRDTEPMSPHDSGSPGPGPVVSLRGVRVSRGGRTLVVDLDLEIDPVEFVAILVRNGAGKHFLLKVLLDESELYAAEVLVDGRATRDRCTHLGYIPQPRAFVPGLPLRGRVLVALGVDGTRW